MPKVNELINRQIHQWNHLRAVLHRHDSEDGSVPPPHPPLPVVTFSPELGCGSRLVAEMLSQQTGFQYFGWSLIDKIAEDMNVQRQIVDRLDEHAKSQIEALLEGMLWGRHVDREEYFRALVRVLRAFAMQGGVILIGRGSNYIVESHEAVRVRLIAPMRIRIENLKSFYSIDEAMAQRRIAESDRQREEFIRVYFKKDIHDPLNYDLSLNLGTMLPVTAAGIIMRALEQFPHFIQSQQMRHILEKRAAMEHSRIQ